MGTCQGRGERVRPTICFRVKSKKLESVILNSNSLVPWISKIFNKRDSNLWQLNPQEYAQLYDSRPKPIEVRNLRKHGPFSARDTGKPQVRGGGRGGRFGRIRIPGKTGGKVKIQLPSSSWGPPQFPLRGAPLLSRL